MTIVFSGGGVAGISWELGVLKGIGDASPAALAALLDPGVEFIGTSAGSTVASQVASGVPLDDLYEAQLSPESAEIDPHVDLTEVMNRWIDVFATGKTGPELCRLIGTMAVEAETLPLELRLEVIRARLPKPDWSERMVKVTAVDVSSGEVSIFTRESGVSLELAVAASCAVPAIWPPVTIDAATYMDGGMASVSHIGLAAGSDWVLALAPMPESDASFGGIALEERARLGDTPTVIVWADDAYMTAVGGNPLDPTTRGPAARVGRETGRRVAADVAALLGV